MAFGSSKSKSSSRASGAQQQHPSALASELIAHELAMMQFLGGGSMDRNNKRFMEEQQQAASLNVRKSKPAPEPLPLGKPLRDANGNTWWGQNDPSSAMEYKAQAPAMRLSFDANVNHSRTTGQMRRGSAASGIPSPLSTTHVIPASAMPGDYHHHHHHNPYTSVHSEGQRRHRSGSSSLTPSPSSSTFNDSESYLTYAPAEPQFAGHDVSASRKAAKGMNLRGRARALFGGH
ncbi:hypothetical protein BT96DRAFT_923037 [Gymnopus androsaceus JB14]|uniref:Uncharacterized protein n=1 Tax=Gymnopus androsaceus JB14 TaxID=1447944 RepID=A0A6A4HBJ6_9AGAR|nr:hypothetical protein BT96DRAFT_923037 [Gymnopus androsaceus JB14]